MGAYYEEMIMVAEDSFELCSKYADFFQDQQYEHGHGGYSGIFAEKPRLEIIKNMHDPVTRKEAEEHCEEENDKWGPAFAYYLGENRWYIGGWCSS